MPKTRFPLSPEFAKPVIIQIAGIAIVLAVLVIISQMNYLVFHSIVEIATIAIAISIFVIVWNARDKIDNGYFIVVGLAILFIGVIDLAHTLAFKGMGVFPGNSSDLPTQLWIAARYLQAFTLLAAPLMAGRRVRTAPVLAIFSAATVFLLWTIYAGIFPSCFIEGQGLTQFKIASEYVISLILVAATVLLYWKRAAFDSRVFWLLAASNILTIGAELAFTAYVSVYGFMNMVGHLFRLVATYCMYLAIVAIGIREPNALLWRNMNTSERQYRELFTEMTNGYALHEIILDAPGTPVDYRFLKVNPAFERMTGLLAKDIEGKTAREVLPRLEQDWIETYGKVVLTGTPARFVNHSIELGKWFEVYAFSPAPGKFAAIFSDITERKRVETALRESEEKYRMLFSNMQDGFAYCRMIFDREGRPEDFIYLNVNQAFDQITGTKTITMKRVTEVYPGIKEAFPELFLIYGRVALTGTPESFDIDFKPIEKWLHISVYSPAKEYFVAVFEDITYRKKAEQEIARIAREWETTFNATSDGICLIDANQNLIRCNNRMGEILGGMKDEDLVGKPCWVVVHKTTGPIPECPFVSAKKTLKRTRIEIPAGDHWFEVTADPVLDSSGTFAGAVHIMRDITERKRAEEEGARLSAIVEYSDEAIIGKTLDGIITSWNAGAERMYGYSAQEMIGKSVSLLVPPDHPDDTVTILERVKNGEPLIHYETLRRKNDGGLINVTLTASPIRDTQNHLIGISIIGHDITERKRAEEALQLTNAMLTSQMEATIDGILIVDDAGKIISYNNRFTDIWGIPPDVIASRLDESVLQLVLDKLVNPEEFLARVRYLYAHRVEKSREEVQLIDTRTLDRYSAPLIGSDSRYYGRIWFFRDITERKRAEDALRQANKQLNLLSSITRHDILNQLMALKGYLYLSTEMIDNPTTLRGYIQKEEQAANAIERQIKFTKDYQELGIAAPEWQNVSANIKKAIAGLPMRDVYVDIDRTDLEIFADRLFEKVFYNLIDNALRYGGADMKTLRISSQESDASLTILCEDDGVGISAEDKKRLFTKGFGKNTGLGLFLSREILAITGITITENGTPGKGARFEITVPKGAWRIKEANA